MVKRLSPLFSGLSLLVIFTLVCVSLVLMYAKNERERDLSSWQDRLSILAENQKESIEQWTQSQFNALHELAANPLLQIYLSQINSGSFEQDDVQRAQFVHLKKLVIETAKRSGTFSGISHEIQSNQSERLNEGIGILDSNGKLLLATRQFPVKLDRVSTPIINALKTGKTQLIDIYPGDLNQPRIGIVVPVSGVQAMAPGKKVPGAVISLINPHITLYKYLDDGWSTKDSDETLLVRSDGVSTTYISPLQPGYSLFHQRSAGDPSLAANFAIERPGDFAIKHDYTGNEVLVTGRRFIGSDRILVQKIDVSEALKESNEHQQYLLTTLLLAVFVIALLFIAIWRHSTSVRLQKLSSVLAAKTALLGAVSAHINDPVFLVDADDLVIFINRALAGIAGLDADDYQGKPLSYIFTSDTVKNLLSHRQDASLADEVQAIEVSGHEYFYHVSCVQLLEGDYKSAWLYVLHDITGIKTAQDKHNVLLEGIIATLVRTADMHDPHCANHSDRTRMVASEIAREMGLEGDEIDQLERAALLANIGKLYVSRQILTKLDPLTDKEELELRNNVSSAVDILKELNFDGPVIDIISQKNELLDGSGYPNGLSGKEIMIQSRILTVANTFVAMTSSRAYRSGRPVKEVIDELLKSADSLYDRQVVATLFHIAENKSGWDTWQSVQVDT